MESVQNILLSFWEVFKSNKVFGAAVFVAVKLPHLRKSFGVDAFFTDQGFASSAFYRLEDDAVAKHASVILDNFLAKSSAVHVVSDIK